MILHSLRSRILLPSIAILLATFSAVLLVTSREIARVNETGQRALYRGKLEAVTAYLAGRERRLAATGMRAAYREGFQQGSLDSLEETYYGGEAGDYPFVLDDGGNLLLHPADRPLPADLTVLAQACGPAAAGEVTVENGDGSRTWILFARFQPWHWTVGWAVPEEVKLAPVRRLQRMVAVVLGTACAGLAGLLAFLVWRLIQPISRLTVAASAMAAGRLDTPLPAGGRDEIGDLTGSLERMRRQLRDKIAQLEASERNYRELVQSANSIVLRWDRDGRILFMNDFGLRLFGFTAQELQGRHVVGTIVPTTESSGRDLAEMIDDILVHPERYELNENENITKDGRRVYIQWSNRPIVDDTGAFQEMLSIGIDITSRKQLEDRLRQAERLEAIGTLAGGIAHDFNNILAAIFGFTELAKMHAGDHQELRNCLDQLLVAAKRARDLVAQILTFSRRQTEERQPLCLALLLKESLKLLRATLPATIDIRQDIASQALVLADPTQIHQLIMNLATNAYHAMEATGGVLTVGLHQVHWDAPRTMGDTDLPAGDYLELTVADTGCGMPPATIRKIFEPYFTTKPQGKGTGLGLSVVHGIVRAHQGAIQVASEPDRGTIFTVFLPVVTAGTAAEEQDAGQEQQAGQDAPARIMVVDDEEALRALEQEFLSQEGHRVTSFPSPTAALEALAADPEGCELLITDLTMPVMTGLDLADHARSLNPKLKIILVSGYGEQVAAEELQAHGIALRLSKPLLRDQLLAAVQRVLNA